MNKNNTKVLALTITFNPSIDRLSKQIDSLTRNQIDLLLVDNGSKNASEIQDLISNYSCDSNIALLKLSDNFGIAYATNKGLQYASEKYYEYVCVFDQDSIPSDLYITTALGAYEILESSGLNPFVVTSLKLNYRNILKNAKNKTFDLSVNKKVLECTELENAIASGSLFSVQKWNVNGEQNAKLFIDLVDTEWLYRSRNNGYRVYGISGVHVNHTLGDGTFNFFGRTITLHSPLRHYYRARNTIVLCKLDYIPSLWKIKSPLSMIYLSIACSIYDKNNGIKHFFSVLKGFKDGMFGKLGRIDIG